ncbi:hypothetical protein GQ602_005959 [Ophiocordyceps camponoti-floridani]|uniref:Uncharacterized protein n=1 Tax=Ophiocordyceps camponoti-floridani TaxID=2030778 RepID=A0A8H4Q2B0_9HYPO|nr:hypothetical protein GQ602_005959 [Ophiocordyceps camponoti-floridani]
MPLLSILFFLLGLALGVTADKDFWFNSEGPPDPQPNPIFLNKKYEAAPALNKLYRVDPGTVFYPRGQWIGLKNDPLCYIDHNTIHGHVLTGFIRYKSFKNGDVEERLTWPGVGQVTIFKRPAAGIRSYCPAHDYRTIGWCGPGCVCCVNYHAKWIRPPPPEPDWHESCFDPDRDMCTKINGEPAVPRVIGLFLSKGDDPYYITMDSIGGEAARLVNTTEVTSDASGSDTLGDHELRYAVTGTGGVIRPEQYCKWATLTIGATADEHIVCMYTQ